MEQQKQAIVAKRVWSIVRVVYMMLRKSISKRKLLLDLNTLLKRGKIAGKAIGNLFQDHQRGPHLAYEFSCSNSPAFPGFISNKRRHHSLNPFACTHAPPTYDHDLSAVDNSPVLPGFGRSPHVRQLRVTDSPFPLTTESDDVIDRAAEDFIRKFYTDLKHQQATRSLSLPF